MDYQSKIRKLYGLLFPTGRAWQFARGSEDRDAVTSNYVDGEGNNFVDGFGNVFVSLMEQFEASEGKMLANAKLMAFDDAYSEIIGVLNTILPDNSEFDGQDATNWERALQIPLNTTDLEERKAKIARQLYYPNGVVERSHYKFVEDQIRAAGFDVYLIENRFWNGSEFEIVDPDSVGTQGAEYGIIEYGDFEYGGEVVGVDYTRIIANSIDDDIDNGFFDAVLEDPVEYGTMEYGNFEYGGGGSIGLPREQQLQQSFFLGGSSFPTIVDVPESRKDELIQLVLKLKPLHTIGFAYINWTN